MAGVRAHPAGLILLALIAGCARPAPTGTSRMAAAPAPASTVEPAEHNVPTPSLLDLTTQDLRARFGEPQQQRRDGGAEVWNYEAADVCRLNLVLQRQRRAQKVVHAQARMDEGGSEGECLSRLELRQ
ncbi:MAG: hypothetical protein IT555_03275 [Acetobacteraceae bacterium]|nr:hypothetical protein [Acetobacteraceae bacterium]